MEPLLAIADEVGAEWPERSRRAAVALLTGEEREDAESLGVRLLRDIRGVFDEEGSDKLSTGRLLEALHVMEEAPAGLAPWRGAGGAGTCPLAQALPREAREAARG